MKRSDVKVRTYGCLAIIIGLFELDLTLRGEGLSEQSRFHSVWAKRSQGLQFVFWQSTRALLSSNLSVRRWAADAKSYVPRNRAVPDQTIPKSRRLRADKVIR